MKIIGSKEHGIERRLLAATASLLAVCTVYGWHFAAAAEQPAKPTDAASMQPGEDAMAIPFSVMDGTGELWGYRKADGSVVIRPRFKMAFEFVAEGSAAVVDTDGWAIINRRGEVLLRPFAVDNAPDAFSEGLARFVKDGKIGFFDRAAHIVIPARYDAARRFSEGLAPVCSGCRKEKHNEHTAWVGGRWGYADRSGKMVVPPRFENAQLFEDGRAHVTIGGQSMWIDHEGRPAARHLPPTRKAEPNQSR
jgi:hypothetical protein